MPDILDLGCGNRKRPGAIGIDINANTQADVVHDLNSFPYPFADDFFDCIYADNVIEHLDNILAVMEELHRIAKPDGKIIIKVPYYRSKWAFVDPTHKHFFTIDSFNYFQPGHLYNKLYNYSPATFKIERVALNDNITRGWLYSMIKAFANSFPGWYETKLSHLFPLDELTFELNVLK